MSLAKRLVDNKNSRIMSHFKGLVPNKKYRIMSHRPFYVIRHNLTVRVRRKGP